MAVPPFARFGEKVLAELFGNGPTQLVVLLGKIVVVNPYMHTYLLSPVPEVEGADKPPPLTAIPIGALGNTPNGVQVQAAYNVGDIVMYAYQPNSATTLGARIGYILGGAPMTLIETATPDELVYSARWDSENFDYRSMPLFQQLLTYAGKGSVPERMTGHGSSDMLPGDWEAAGRLVSLIVSDYFAGLRGTCAELLVSGIDRRLIYRSMLETRSTVDSLQDTAILNRSTIRTTAHVGNVDDAWYNYLSEEDEQIIPRTDDNDHMDSPRYRDMTQAGDILYGEHRTLLDSTGDTPLYNEYLGNDGTRYILSAKQLTLGKMPGLTSVRYVGPRLNKEEQGDFTPTPEELGDPLSELNTEDAENWQVTRDDYLFALNSYPEEFLDENAAEYPDPEEKEIEDSLLPDKKFILKGGKGTIDFLDDGSIKLKDAWGSYILLSHGNIELHAMNNIFTLASRDMLSFAGANSTLYANRDLAIQAYEGDVRQIAGKTWRAQSASTDKTGETILESKNIVRTLSTNYITDALHISFTCRDITKDALEGSGSFRVIAPNFGQVSLAGDAISLDARTAAIATPTAGAAFGGAGAIIAGDMSVRGGITLLKANTTINTVDNTGKKQARDIPAGYEDSIAITQGNIYVKGSLLCGGEGRFFATIIGGGIRTTAKQREDKLEFVKNGDKIKGNINAAINRYAERTPKADLPKPIDPLSPSKTSKETFEFGKNSAACSYRLLDALPTGKRGDIVNKGYLDRKGEISYIYPGTDFWKKSGVTDFTVKGEPETRGFITIPTAISN